MRVTGRGRGYGLRLEPGDYVMHIAIPNNPAPTWDLPFRVLRTVPSQEACQGIAAPTNATVDLYDTISLCYSLNDDVTTMLPLLVTLNGFRAGSLVNVQVIDTAGQQRGRKA